MSNRYDSTREAWESIWNHASVDIELETSTYRRSQRVQAAYLSYLSKTDVILEAGSGLSAALIPLRQMGYNVVGLDYAENALQLSRQHTPDLALVVGDVHALPHPENSIGAYLSFGVLEHFEQGMGAALREAYRILKPNGSLIMTIPYPNLIWKLAQWRREQQGKKLIDDDFYESTYTQHELIAEVTKVGFELAEAIPTSHSFTLWGLHPIFRAKGYYKTNALAEGLGELLRIAAPWEFNFMTLIIARKPE